MAVETQTEHVVPEAEKPVVKQPTTPEEEDPKNPEAELETKKPSIPPSVSFKEESNLVADLTEPERKALGDLKQLLQSALSNHELDPPPPPPPAPAAEPKPAEAEPKPAANDEENAAAVAPDDDGAKTVEAIEESVVPVAAAAAEKPPADVATIWGVPLLVDERSDAVLLKFLRARDFKPKEALAMLKNAVSWRRDFGIEALVGEDLGAPELEKVVFMHGVDRDGHPVCYNRYGEFEDKELYDLAFADEEKRKRFLKWRIQFLEKGIRQLLNFSPGGVSTIVQVNDLKSAPGPLKRELRQALALLQDNYPEFAAKQVFINVPWWNLAFNRMMSAFFTQRTKSKFVLAVPSKSADTLFKYIAPEQVPVCYGGLSNENDPDFTTIDIVTETTIKPSVKQIIVIPITEACLLVWQVRVLGWDVTYGAEFVPSSEEGYTVIVQKARKLGPNDDSVVKSSFKIGEPGKLVITVNNATSKKKKKLLYRYKARSCSTESIFGDDGKEQKNI